MDFNYKGLLEIFKQALISKIMRGPEPKRRRGTHHALPPGAFKRSHGAPRLGRARGRDSLSEYDMQMYDWLREKAIARICQEADVVSHVHLPPHPVRRWDPKRP
jgi:hypothetical protein